MADAGQVTARQRAILTAIIESYIETGEPVGSGTIARLQSSEGAGFSSATVRNEMAELADEGLLEQRSAVIVKPHRVECDQAPEASRLMQNHLLALRKGLR